jgi:hypothetical protein
VSDGEAQQKLAQAEAGAATKQNAGLALRSAPYGH